MTSSLRPDNAALLYTPGAYHVQENKIIGRTAAGNSFLNAFFKHFDTDLFGIAMQSTGEFDKLVSYASELGLPLKLKRIRHDNPAGVIPFQTEFVLDPMLTFSGRKRDLIGSSNYSICGYTHAISTYPFVEGMHTMRYAGTEEWDGLICASRAVKAAIERLFDHHDEHLISRFGKAPPRLQLPVIPLGIDCANFESSEELRKDFRSKYNCDDNEIVILTVSRLDPSEKFDPFPAFLALERAQQMLGNKIKLSYHCCGWFNGKVAETAFFQGANNLMPSVRFSLSNGVDSLARSRALSGADLFLFPIDNFQESFGLAPVEAMAAGLPVISTDWDGIKDTVSEDVGFRVPTVIPTPSTTQIIEWSMQTAMIDPVKINTVANLYVHYDIDLMAKHIVELAQNSKLRAKMSAAAKNRAKSVFDWSVVIPQMQSFFGELTQIRRTLNPKPEVSEKPKWHVIPTVDYLQDFATIQRDIPTEKVRLRKPDYTVADLLSWRGLDQYLQNVKMYELEPIEGFIKAIEEKGVEWCDITPENFPQYQPGIINTLTRFLIKYGFADAWSESFKTPQNKDDKRKK